jgi:hypothetical protein
MSTRLQFTVVLAKLALEHLAARRPRQPGAGLPSGSSREARRRKGCWSPRRLPANDQNLKWRRARLKIVVSPVRVRVQPPGRDEREAREALVSICSRSPGHGHSNRTTASRGAFGIRERPWRRRIAARSSARCLCARRSAAVPNQCACALRTPAARSARPSAPAIGAVATSDPTPRRPTPARLAWPPVGAASTDPQYAARPRGRLPPPSRTIPDQLEAERARSDPQVRACP